MADDHLGGCYLDVPDTNTFMPDVWTHLIDKYSIKSIVDVGCGAGWNTAWFHERGFYAIGIEGWPDAIAKTKMPMERMIVHDYTKGPLRLPTAFDLAWCSEFVEHVEKQYVPNFMETFKSCKYVCMTHGLPGQGGFHHVNEQPLDYWINVMHENGFFYDKAESEYLRSTWNNQAWGRNTLAFFYDPKRLAIQ